MSSTENLLADYWTEAELAEQVRKCERTVERWRKLKIGPPATRMGKEIIYNKQSARSWLKAGEQPSVRSRRQREIA
jgi:hypothetical protein